MTPQQIRAFRERYNLTQKDLAEALGLPEPKKGGQVTIARWETGRQQPPPFLWRALEHLAAELALASE